MQYRQTTVLGILALILLCSWGFYAHKRINNAAVFTLPAELAAFYKQHIDYITEKAVDADKRCYVDTLESPRHFIDLDDYEEETPDSVPIHWSKAKEKYSERRLRAHGIVPWQIHFTYQKLTTAFRRKDVEAIVRHSADLGHYVADAHVPLHTTSNYNGQLTGQLGIHAFWESRLPEMFAEDYNLFVGKAQYISDPLQLAWDIIRESHELVDSVLKVEKALSRQFPKHLQRTYMTRNNVLIASYSDAYAKEYPRRLQGMVERRMRQAIFHIGSYWTSAWIDAGQPVLNLKAELPGPAADTTLLLKTILGREEWH